MNATGTITMTMRDPIQASRLSLSLRSSTTAFKAVTAHSPRPKTTNIRLILAHLRRIPPSMTQ